MGNGSSFLEVSFGNYYTEKSVSGIKILSHKENAKNMKPIRPNNLPKFSHSENAIYAKRNSKGKINQITVYKNHIRQYDIDWGHRHGKYKETDVHVHYYKNETRGQEGFDPNPEQIKIREAVLNE